MRHVDPPTRPWGWQTHVLKKGRAWLQLPGNRGAQDASPLWRRYRDETAELFGYMCCYTAVTVYNGTADHFIPWSKVRKSQQAHLAYQWSNIRYAAGWINSSKQDVEFPDPFKVDDDWFELHLPSLELRATTKVPPSAKAAVDNLLKRVCDDDRIMRVRREHLAQYRQGLRPLALVDAENPLLGRALRNHPQHLLAADRAPPFPSQP